MADKQTPFSEMDEEEFHLSDDDIDHELEGLDEDIGATEDFVVGDIEGSSARAEKKKVGFLKGLLTDRKRLVIVLMIVFAIVYAISKLFSTKHQHIDDIQPVSHPASMVATEPREKMLANVQTTAGSTVKTAPMPVTTNTAAPISSEPVAPAMPAALTALPTSSPTSSPAASPAPQADDSALTQQLQTLQKDNQALANKLAEVSAQLVQVSSAMNNLNNKVDSMAKQPLAAATISAAKPLPKLVTDQHYYVEAVVPGRAWIQTASGETITVTVGEEIKGLGNVVSIEPATGDVVTTSGEIIKYGPY